jgi:peptidoglycan/LPS O-acetylase OafA/YrhL
MAELGASSGVQAESRRVHLTHVEGLRATAALVVYLNHAYAHTWNPLRGQAPNNALSAFSYSLIAGHLSVTVFIVISGFCLTLPAVGAGDRLSGGAAAFFKRRARRILPPYYGALALCLVLIGTVIGAPTGTFWDVPIMVTRTSIISHVLLLQNLFATGSINYVFWSIAVEWQIYFLFPLLLAGWRRFGPWVMTSGVLVAGYVLRVVFGETRLARAHPHYVGMFALGMLAAYVAQSPRSMYVAARDKFPWIATCVVALTTTVALTLSWGIKLDLERFYLLDLPVGILATSVLVLSSKEGSKLGRVFSWKPLVFVGTFSYSFYLVHAPVLQLLWQYVLTPAKIEPDAMFAFYLTIGLSVTLVASYAFFLMLEQRFLRKPSRHATAPLPAA